MALYNIYRWNRRTQTKTVLGRVRARNSPAAVLKGWKKYKVPQAQMRYVGAEPVAPPKPSINDISPEDREHLRQLLGGMNKLMKKTLKREAA